MKKKKKLIVVRIKERSEEWPRRGQFSLWVWARHIIFFFFIQERKKLKRNKYMKEKNNRCSYKREK